MVGGLCGVDIVCHEDNHIVVGAAMAMTGVVTDMTTAAVVVEMIGVHQQNQNFLIVTHSICQHP